MIAIDPPGIGGSELLPEGEMADTAGVADRIVAALRAASVERYTLVGHDVGAWISYALASRHPKMVERVCLTEAAIPTIAPSRSKSRRILARVEIELRAGKSMTGVPLPASSIPTVVTEFPHFQRIVRIAAAYAFTLFRLRLGPSFDRLLPASAPTYDEPSSETASSKTSTKALAHPTIEDKRSARSSRSL